MTDTPKTGQDVCHIFWEMEQRLGLLDLDTQGVKAWQYSRFRIYRHLMESTKLQEQGHTRSTTLHRLKNIIHYIINSLTNNPFFNPRCDVLILSHPRVKEVNGEMIDIYTKYLRDELEEKKVDFLELESPYLDEHKKPLKKSTTYTDFIVLTTMLFRKLFPLHLTVEEKKSINDINISLSNNFKRDIDITNILIDGIMKFKIKYYLYTRLLTKLKPKVIYILISYDNGDLVKAAKDRGIEVRELQHGIYSEYHLGYSFPGRVKELDYFPNKFLVWNHYWKNLIPFPIPEQNIEIKKFQYLENSKISYSGLIKKRQLIVLSQGNIGNLLAGIVLNKLHLFSDMKIVYKLHPGEYDRYRSYDNLQKLLDLHPDIEIIEDADLHMLLATSQYQLGVNSTALLEGVEFGCETILCDTPGIEYMKKFIDEYHLKEVDGLIMSQDSIDELIS